MGILSEIDLYVGAQEGGKYFSTESIENSSFNLPSWREYRRKMLSSYFLYFRHPTGRQNKYEIRNKATKHNILPLISPRYDVSPIPFTCRVWQSSGNIFYILKGIEYIPLKYLLLCISWLNIFLQFYLNGRWKIH